MLKILRHKRVAKIVLWAILILILPAFVIWGTGNLGRSKDSGPTFVGLIDNRKVTFDNFADSLTCMRAQVLLSLFNQQEAMESIFRNSELMGKMAWDRLLMAREAKKSRIKVGDDEVIAYIRSLPIFNKNGKFDDRIYNYVLRNNVGLPPRSFEEMMRENLAMQKLHADLTSQIKVSDEEVLEQYKAEGQRFKVSYALLPVDAEKTYANVIGLMANEKMTFEEAAEKSGLKTETTDFFSKSDYIEGLGEGAQLTGAAARMKAEDVSSPVTTRKGPVIFKLVETQDFDEEAFNKEKVEYSKKILAAKKNKFLEDWLKDLESKNTLNIDLKEYEKYYR